VRRLTTPLAIVATLVAAAPACALAPVKIDGTFDQPVYLTGPPGSRLQQLVVEKGGTIHEVEDHKYVEEPWLDIHEKVDTDSEEGLLSMAFAPDYDDTGRYWIAYSADVPNVPGSDLVVEERDHDDPSHAAEVIRIPHHEFANHNGGQLQLGPDGNLWLSTGDGGSGNDPNDNAQNPRSLLGKLLRFTPIAGGGRAIPADNPYADGAAGEPEIWALGLRNPWRFSFDRQTGDLMIGDVGQGAVEEIDRAPAPGLGRGDNYGWVRMEGDTPTGIGGPPPEGLHPPLITHTHDEGWFAITGGYVIRDDQMCERGKYVYGDFTKGELWLADPVTGEGAPSGASVPQLSSFGEDGLGGVYAISLAGNVYRLQSGDVEACPPTPPPPGGDGGTGGPPPGGTAPPGGGGGTPPPGGGAAAPLRLSAITLPRQRALRNRRVFVRAACSATCRVTLSGRIELGRAVLRLRGARADLRPGTYRTLVAALGRRVRRSVRRVLRGGSTVRVRLTLRASGAAGGAATRSLTVVVRR
jgi:glucose/sorbosone dehydrogenase